VEMNNAVDLPVDPRTFARHEAPRTDNKEK